MSTIHWSVPSPAGQLSERTEHRAESLVLSVEQAASLLGISRGLGYELVRRGELPCLRLGRRMVVPRVALMAMLAGSAHSTGSATSAAVAIVSSTTTKASSRHRARRTLA